MKKQLVFEKITTIDKFSAILIKERWFKLTKSKQKGKRLWHITIKFRKFRAYSERPIFQ